MLSFLKPNWFQNCLHCYSGSVWPGIDLFGFGVKRLLKNHLTLGRGVLTGPPLVNFSLDLPECFSIRKGIFVVLQAFKEWTLCFEAMEMNLEDQNKGIYLCLELCLLISLPCVVFWAFYWKGWFCFSLLVRFEICQRTCAIIWVVASTLVGCISARPFIP